MDSKEIILNVEKLNTTFVSDKKKIRIVKDVSFQLKRGKTLAVVGESGCGKSVTMNSIMRFTGKNAIVEAKSIQYNAMKDGKIEEHHLESIKEPNGAEMRALRGPDLSMVFQDPMSSLNPVYKVGDQVAEGLLQHNKGMTKQEAREKVLEMFRKLGIPDPEERIDCYPHQFSGGMKQRVVIAIAMMAVLWYTSRFEGRDRDLTWDQFQELITDEAVADVTVRQNKDVPTGRVEIELKQEDADGDLIKYYYVSDVNEIQDYLKEQAIDYEMLDKSHCQNVN